MSIIVDQNSAGNIDAPSAGSSTIFVDQSGQLAVKQANGTSGSIPTVSSSNTQVIYNSQGNLTGNSSLTYNSSTTVLSAPFFSGNGAALSSITGSNVSGIVSLAATASYAITAGAASTAGTVTASAQPNITSVGTLTSLSFNGAGNIDMNGRFINNLSQPVNDNDAASKLYVDTVAAQGLHVKEGVDAGTVSTLAAASGGSVTYNNGASGVGATLTLGVPLASLDGFSLSNGDRVLIKDELNAAYNGIYVRTSSTVFTRGTDFDSDATIEGGDFVFIVSGNTLGGTGWVQTGTVNDVGVDNITFDQFSGAGAYTAGVGLVLSGTEFSIGMDQILNTVTATGNVSANYFIGNGSQLTGLSTTSISNGTSNVRVFSSGNVTMSSNGVANTLVVTNTGANIPGTLSVTGAVSIGNGAMGTGSLSVVANVTAAYLVAMTAVTTSGNVTGGTLIGTTGISAAGTSTLGNITASGNATVTGNVLTAARLTANNITGNLSIYAPNYTGANISVTGTTTVGGATQVGSLATGSTVSALGNITGANLITGGLVTATGNVRGANLVTPGIVSATGNVTGNYFIGNGSLLTGLSGSSITNGTSNVIVNSSANVTISSAGTANVLVVANTGATVAGTISASGNITAGNFIATGSSGNITGANVIFANSITTTGSVAFGNLVVLSGGNASATGKGIAFPATQSPSTDPNTLDDYEEGSWTPSVGGSSVAGTVSYTSTRYGRYTKVGRLVTAQFDVILSSAVTGSTGQTFIYGLPFTCVASTSAVLDGGGGVVSYFSGISGTNYTMTLYIDNNTTGMLPVFAGGTTVISYLAIASLGNQSRLAGTITYTTSS